MQRPQDNITVPGSIGPDAAEPPPVAGRPDERPLWRLLSAGDFDTLDARIAALRRAYPGWQPPPRLRSLLDQAAAERELAALKSRKDWPGVQRLVAAHPDLARCTRPDDAAAANFSPGAAGTAEATLASCPDAKARLALLGAAFDRFGPSPALERGLGSLDATSLSPSVSAEASRLRKIVAVRRLGIDLAAHAPDVLERGAALRDALAARRDAGLQAGLGWTALAAGRPADAVSWFQASKQSDRSSPVDFGLGRALLATGNEAAARRLLAASPDGAALLAGLDDRRVAESFRRGDFATAAVLAGRRPDPPALLGWSLLRLHRADGAAAAFEAHVRRHGDADSARGLITALIEAGRPDQAAEAGRILGGAVATSLALAPAGGGPDLGYRVMLLRLRRALDNKDMPAATRLAAALAGPALDRHDPAAATTLGWAALDNGRPADAETWFCRGSGDDAAYGAVLARLRSGNAAGAAAGARAHGGDGRWRQLRLDAEMAAAQRREDAAPGDPAVAEAARAVLADDPGRRDAAVLLGWNAVHAGHRGEGASIFEALYRRQPGRDIADAVAAAEPDRSHLDSLAAELGGDLAPAATHRAAQDALGRKEFLAANVLEPGATPYLAGIGAPTAGVGATVRSKSGGEGTSRLDSVTTDLHVTAARGTDQVTVRLHTLSLDAGRSTTPGTTTRLPLGVEPSVSWVREATSGRLLTPFATLGISPLGGRIAATPVGRTGVGWQLGDLSIRATVLRESVTESVLSFTGITDGTAGRTFGRVTESGGKAEAYLQLAPRWGVYGNAGAGVRDGVGVRSNGHVQAAATLSYDLRVQGLDTLTVGPSYGFSAFGRDLSGFTPGQGGYYSPRSLHLVGAALRLLSAEGRDLVVRASAFAGLQLAHSDGPADGRGGRLPSTRQDGFNATGEVTAAYRLSDQWVLGGMVRYQVSPQYNDVYAGLALVRSFGARAALVSAELPRFDQR